MRLLGCDPGLASFGLALYSTTGAWEGDRDDGVWLDVKVITTKATGSQRKADSTAARCALIARQLAWWCDEYRPDAICCEAIALPHGRIQTSVVSALGRVRGIVDAVAAERQLPVLESGPQALKRAVTGDPSAPKDELRAVLELRWPGLQRLWPTQKTLHEHAADACAAVLAARERWPTARAA